MEFSTRQKVLEEINKTSPTIFNNSLLKYRRQFYIRNSILFLNYLNYFYILFLSCIFASGIFSYSLFFRIRAFYIRNLILFLNYPNYFYILFLSCIFASGTFSYSLFFRTPVHFRLGDRYVGDALSRHHADGK
jgi:hypothetical protein